MIVALVATLVYFAGFNFGATGGGSIPAALVRPDLLFPFILVQLGSVAAGTDPFSFWGYLGLGIFGLLLLAVSAVVVAGAWEHRPDPQLALASGLIIFALLFDISVYFGRGAAGIGSATTSRYTTYNLLLLLGDYFGLLVLFRVNSGAQRRRVRRVAGIFAVLLLVQVGAASTLGLSSGETQRLYALESAKVTLHYLDATPSQIQTFEYPNVPEFRKLSALAQRDNLSIFANVKNCESPEGLRRWLSSTKVDTGADPKPFEATGALESYLANHRRANEAWRTLLELHANHLDLAVGYPAWGITFPASLLAWAGTENASTYAGGALAAYSPEYGAMFEVAKKSLAEGNHPKDLPDVVLPAPQALTALLLDDDRAAEAWRVLSILYFERGDLVRAFPGLDFEFPKRYIDWAVSSSKSPDLDGTGSLLRGYAGELQSMQSILASVEPGRADGLTSDRVLPIPHSLESLLTGDPSSYAAWMLLSDVYRGHRNVQPPIQPPSECFDLVLVRWASGPGHFSDRALSLYTEQLDGIRDALER